MQFQRGTKWGQGAQRDRDFTDGFTQSWAFDFSSEPVQNDGYESTLFRVENDALPTIITDFFVVFAAPLMEEYWKAGLRIAQREQANQDRHSYYYNGELADQNQLPVNGFIGPEFFKGRREIATEVRPGTSIGIRLSPLVPPHWNFVMNPVGKVYIAGGRLQ